MSTSLMLSNMLSSLNNRIEFCRQNGMEWQAEILENYAREIRGEFNIPDPLPVVREYDNFISTLGTAYIQEPAIGPRLEEDLESSLEDLRYRTQGILQETEA